MLTKNVNNSEKFQWKYQKFNILVSGWARKQILQKKVQKIHCFKFSIFQVTPIVRF